MSSVDTESPVPYIAEPMSKGQKWAELKKAELTLHFAARRMQRANEELDEAEREHRIATELVESWERLQ